MNQHSISRAAGIFTSILPCSAVSFLCEATALANPPQDDHLALAEFYVDHIPLNFPIGSSDNSYGGTYGDMAHPVYLSTGFTLNQDTHSMTRCGSFLALLLKQ